MSKEEKIKALSKFWKEEVLPEIKHPKSISEDIYIRATIKTWDESINSMMPDHPPLDSRGREIPLDVLREKLERQKYLGEPALDDYGKPIILFLWKKNK